LYSTELIKSLKDIEVQAFFQPLDLNLSNNIFTLGFTLANEFDQVDLYIHLNVKPDIYDNNVSQLISPSNFDLTDKTLTQMV
jgi:hypothetical protein